MRTSLCIALVLLTLTIGCGILTSGEIRMLSDRYVSAAEELLILTENEEWQRAGETVESDIGSWEQTVPWLQTLINHDDTDSVTAALAQLRAGIRAQEQAMCYEACAMLRENARHLYHRDAFTLGNVL